MNLLKKGLDFSNITYGPRRRVQSIEGVLSLMSTSKDFLKSTIIEKTDEKPPEIKKKVAKFKEKLIKKAEKTRNPLKITLKPAKMP